MKFIIFLFTAWQQQAWLPENRDMVYIVSCFYGIYLYAVLDISCYSFPEFIPLKNILWNKNKSQEEVFVTRLMLAPTIIVIPITFIFVPWQIIAWTAFISIVISLVMRIFIKASAKRLWEKLQAMNP